MKFNEGSITNRLIEKFDKKYICIAQCKSGPTWFNRSLTIMDLWCLAKSWAHPNVIGCEIKISRQDFLNDTKWMSYLDYCNEFYFVTPSTKIISPDEVPEQAGLLCFSSTGNVIYTKKKAPYREVEIPEYLYRYILMHRIKIIDHTEDTHDYHIKYWQDWFQNKKVSRDLGCRISKSLQARIEEEVIAARRNNDRLQEDIKQLMDIKTFLRSIGIDIKDIHRWQINDMIKDKLNEIESGFDKKVREDVIQCIDTLQRIKEVFFNENRTPNRT